MELKRRTPEEREAYLLDQIVNLQSALAAANEECERLSGELALERVSNVRMPIKRVEQTTPRNCGQACLAMVFEVPIDEVPKEASAEFWDANAVQEWLSTWGLQEIRVRCFDQSIWPANDVRCIVDGPSPRGEKMHAVVCTMQGPQGWVLDADPHPDNNGLADEPYSATFFAVKNPAEFIRLQSQLAAKDAMLAAAEKDKQELIDMLNNRLIYSGYLRTKMKFKGGSFEEQYQQWQDSDEPAFDLLNKIKKQQP